VTGAPGCEPAGSGRTAARMPCALSLRTRRRLSRRPALYLLWLTVAITLITVTLAINCGGGTGSCTQSWAGLGVCAGQVPADSPRPGLPSAGRTPGIPLTARPAAGLVPVPRGRALAPDATPGPNQTPSASRTGQPAFGHPHNQSRLSPRLFSRADRTRCYLRSVIGAAAWQAAPPWAGAYYG